MSAAAPIPDPPKRQMSLFDFIEKNQKLLTTIVAFIALTAFLIQVSAGNSFLSNLVPGIPLFGALLLILELYLQFPVEARDASWRLGLFQLVVLALGFALGWMWVERFPTATAGVLLLAFALVFFLIMTVFALFLAKPMTLVTTKLIGRKLSSRQSQYVFLGSVVLVAVLFFAGMAAFEKWGPVSLPNSLPAPAAIK